MAHAFSPSWFGCAALAATLVGCGSKGAVALTAHVSSSSVEVTGGPLGAALGVEFDLVLELGGSAPEGTSVEPQSFALVRGDTVLVDALSLAASERFPVSLGPGDKKTVRFTLEGGSAINADEASAICSGAVRVRGSVSDTASDGKPTPAEGAPVEPECP